MNDDRPSANVTLVAEVGDMKSGNIPIKFEIRISTAKVITTGKYCKPCGPTMSSSILRTASTPTSSVCCPEPGSSSESLPLKIQITNRLMMQASTNITVYQGIAFSGVYTPKAASGVVPNFPRTFVQNGYVYFISKLYAA